MNIAWPATPLRMASPFRKSMSPGMIVKDTPLQTAATTTNSRRTTPGSARKAPPPKPKHMDSQIEFAPVEDSGAAGAIDSQVLTEHQKEVKERQRNSEAGKLFSSLVVKTERGKEREREREVVVLEDTPVGEEDMDVSRIEETQVEGEGKEVEEQQQEEETISFISEMPVPRQDSNPQFLLTRPPTQESGDVALSSEIELSSEPEMDSPGAQEWEESNGDDVEMSNTTDADADADADNSDYGSSISELPSIEDDDFVDAPDQPPNNSSRSRSRSSRSSSRSSSPRKNMMMKVEVAAPPPSSSGDGNSSPDAQIIDEQRASHGLPAAPKPAKGKRKARKKASPEVLGTIVIASEPPPPPAQEPSVWYRTRSTRLAGEKERQGSLEVPEGTKASKPKSVENTPSRAAKTATPSKAAKRKKAADTPSRKGKAVEATPSRVSPPRTRASARRGISETPKAVVQPGLCPRFVYRSFQLLTTPSIAKTKVPKHR